MKTSDINNLGNAYRSIYEAKTKEEEVSDNKDFKPHMMYDPETGKGYKAEKPEDHERMSKMGYTHEEPDMVKEKKLPRQMLDPKKDVMVVKNNKVIVIDKSKEKEYLKKGWGLAEQIEEAVSPEQQAAIAISKKEKEEEMKNEGSVKDLAIKIDRVVAKMNKDSKLKAYAKKFASMAMDTMDIEKSLEKALPSSISGAKMISVLEKKHNEALDPVDDKEVDKKFKDRKDKDIDNDGDVDDSDKYLHNRRAKVDDAIDAKKKEKKENAKPKMKKKLKASADANFEPMSDVAKSPKTAEIEKIGEEFIAMLEAALKSDGKDKDGKDLSKKATDDEEIDDKESPKSKEFIKKHDGSDKDIEDKEEEAEEETPKAGKVTKEKSGKRAIDNTIGDTKVVNPVKEGTEEMKSLIDMARAHLSGEKVDFSNKVLKKEVKEKNPYDARFKEAKAFMQRMDKRRGITREKKDDK
ncbi:hypothetical protein PQZ07_00320 [bacterium]|nr:hypothetical protein [bacterium]